MINIDLLSIDSAFWTGIANHLWQSTLFALAAWLITLFLKKNRARIRYWIWFSVSVKFLIPFSLIISLGGLIAPEWIEKPVTIPSDWELIQTINKPFDLPDIKEVSVPSDITDASASPNKLPLMTLLLWICGAFTVLLNWWRQIARVSKLVGKAELLPDVHAVKGFHSIQKENRLLKKVRLVFTQDTMEPGVYGIFRPLLLLPAGIFRHINEPELEAILLHEFEHIRCRDNLIAFMHMIVQTLFWFHPVVWFTGSRLVFEREMACDESVLQSGKNPKIYAEGILKVCEYFVKAPSVCASGVIGANLKKRVEGIIKNQIGHKLSILKKLILSVAGLAVIGIPLSIGILNAPPSQAGISNSDLKKSVNVHKPESLQVSNESENNSKLSKIINKPNNGDNSGNISNTGTVLLKEISGIPILKNRSHTIVAADKRIQTAEKPERNSKSIKKPMEAATGDTDKKDIKPKTDSASAYISRGITCLKEGKIEDAVSDFSRGIAIDPQNALAYVARGSAYHRLGKLDNAISDYDRALEIDPKLAIAYQNRGSVYNHQGLFDAAMPDYNKAIELNPELAVAYQDRGSIYQSQGHFDNAVSDYSRAIEINPNLAIAYHNRGSVYYRQNLFDAAISDYYKAIELNPELAVAYQDRGVIYQDKGQLDNAISDYSRALELKPEDTATYIRRGTAYFSQDQNEKALSDFNSAINLDPGQYSAYVYRGYYFQSIEMYEKALDDYNKALELNPEDAVIYIRRGTVYLSQDQPEKAFYDFNSAISLDHIQYSAYVYRGYCFQLIEMYDRAVDDYHKALELNPKADIVSRLIAQIPGDETGNGESDDQQEIECRQILPVGSNITRKVCRTKADWAMTEAIKRFNRHSTYIKMEHEK